MLRLHSKGSASRVMFIVFLVLTLLGYWSSPTPRQHGSRHEEAGKTYVVGAERMSLEIFFQDDWFCGKKNFSM
ncbi:hypothetical protein Y032_0098g3117 [Ancylostoma ceylanicum]|nr:hypothetical protein Y032_0098g3117 [Ancylostoma ceylanicum]